jgi:hypothetical protein
MLGCLAELFFEQLYSSCVLVALFLFLGFVSFLCVSFFFLFDSCLVFGSHYILIVLWTYAFDGCLVCLESLVRSSAAQGVRGSYQNSASHRIGSRGHS